jgi:hypothetical protein
MPRKPILPPMPLKFKDFLEGVLKVKPPKKTPKKKTRR